MWDATNCTVTIDMVILALGLLGLCLVWSRYKAALGIIYLATMYWVYTLHQSDLLQLVGQDAFYWSGAAAIGLGGVLMMILNSIPDRY